MQALKSKISISHLVLVAEPIGKENGDQDEICIMVSGLMMANGKLLNPNSILGKPEP